MVHITVSVLILQAVPKRVAKRGMCTSHSAEEMHPEREKTEDERSKGSTYGGEKWQRLKAQIKMRGQAVT